LDTVLLVAVVVTGAIWMLPRIRWQLRWLAAAVALLLFGSQLLLEGFYWQFGGAYVVLAIVLAWRYYSLRRSASISPRPRWRIAAMVVLLGLTAGPWLVAPAVPRLTHPSGPYPVGTSIHRWVDPSRAELASSHFGGRRNVVAQIFYPAAQDSGGGPPPYIDGLGELPKSVAGLPRWFMRGYGLIDSHARQGATLSAAKPNWPLILFSPGYGAPRAYYTSLATDLASRGMIVMLFDHPFESAVTRLAGGRIATNLDGFAKIAGNRAREAAFMVAEQEVRARDLRFGLDRLLVQQPFAGRVRMDRIVAGGHSFGGAAGVVAATQDSRIIAAFNIDGTVYGDVSRLRLAKPFLLIESDVGVSPHGDQYRAAADRLMATAPQAARYVLVGANHFSFTDGLLFFAPLGRSLLGLALGGGRDTGEVHQRTARLIEEFVSNNGCGLTACSRATQHL
jgi:dienelactone hydrolase